MADPKKIYYDKRGEIMVKNLTSHGFEAYYCEDKAAALDKALELIPKGATVGWGGAMSAQQIGLLDAMNDGEYNAIDRIRRPIWRNGKKQCAHASRQISLLPEPMH